MPPTSPPAQPWPLPSRLTAGPSHLYGSGLFQDTRAFSNVCFIAFPAMAFLHRQESLFWRKITFMIKTFESEVGYQSSHCVLKLHDMELQLILSPALSIFF